LVALLLLVFLLAGAVEAESGGVDEEDDAKLKLKGPRVVVVAIL
jgi:hypothetical protein